MDHSAFDKRGYPVVSARAGYGEWAASYEDTVAYGLDEALLPELRLIRWPDVAQAADLACGTGRTGEWLAGRGVSAIDGVDLTPEMLEIARTKRAHRSLRQADVADTGSRRRATTSAPWCWRTSIWRRSGRSIARRHACSSRTVISCCSATTRSS